MLKNNRSTANYSLEDSTRMRSIIASDKMIENLRKDKDRVSKPSSRDISYFHEKVSKPNRSEKDQEILNTFLKPDNNKLCLPTELHQLEN